MAIREDLDDTELVRLRIDLGDLLADAAEPITGTRLSYAERDLIAMELVSLGVRLTNWPRCEPSCTEEHP